MPHTISDMKLEDNFLFIDPKIRNLVIALNEIEIQTSASCEGHIGTTKHGLHGLFLIPFNTREYLFLSIL